MFFSTRRKSYPHEKQVYATKNKRIFYRKNVNKVYFVERKSKINGRFQNERLFEAWC